MIRKIQTELQKRGTCGIRNGKVLQVTQAIDEQPDKVKMLMFGDLVEQKTIPIEQACAKCDFWSNKFTNIRQCQERQQEEGRARGFHKVICPNQFEES